MAAAVKHRVHSTVRCDLRFVVKTHVILSIPLQQPKILHQKTIVFSQLPVLSTSALHFRLKN